MSEENVASQSDESSGFGAVVMLPMPEGMQRVETGVVQFGDDWPSIHIRGDVAMFMAMLMRTAAQSLRVSINDEISAKQLERYAVLMSSCREAWPRK